MNERLGSPPAGPPADGAALYVITLVTSTAPASLEPPTGPELEGLAVFRSRRVEDGRERFRVHLGYFPSAAAAENILPIVRRTHPAAFVAPAPRSNMGSLDDTAIARFSVLKPIGPEPAPLTAAGAATLDGKRYAPTPEREELPVLRPSDAIPTAERASDPKPKDAQHFAVQLVWTREQVDLTSIPWLSIFTGYLLYGVETERGGRRWYGVRLGFYADANSARLVAQYVRSDYKGVAVVPVSDREIARASRAVINLTAVRSARGVLATRARWPAAAVAVDSATLGQLTKVAAL